MITSATTILSKFFFLSHIWVRFHWYYYDSKSLFLTISSSFLFFVVTTLGSIEEGEVSDINLFDSEGWGEPTAWDDEAETWIKFALPDASRSESSTAQLEAEFLPFRFFVFVSSFFSGGSSKTTDVFILPVVAWMGPASFRVDWLFRDDSAYQKCQLDIFNYAEWLRVGWTRSTQHRWKTRGCGWTQILDTRRPYRVCSYKFATQQFNK